MNLAHDFVDLAIHIGWKIYPEYQRGSIAKIIAVIDREDELILSRRPLENTQAFEPVLQEIAINGMDVDGIDVFATIKTPKDQQQRDITLNMLTGGRFNEKNSPIRGAISSMINIHPAMVILEERMIIAPGMVPASSMQVMRDKLEQKQGKVFLSDVLTIGGMEEFFRKIPVAKITQEKETYTLHATRSWRPWAEMRQDILDRNFIGEDEIQYAREAYEKSIMREPL